LGGPAANWLLLLAAAMGPAEVKHRLAAAATMAGTTMGPAEVRAGATLTSYSTTLSWWLLGGT
jgi:hypothetical protein